MKRVYPRIGDDYLSGRIVGILPPKGSNRSIRVRVKCAHCTDGYFEERFSDVRRGIRKTCKCLRDKCFKDYNLRGVGKLDPDRRREIFEAGELLGSPERAAQHCGVGRVTASFAWQYERKRLEALPEDQLRAVYEMSQTHTTAKVMEQYGYSKAEVIAIGRIWKRRLEAADDARKDLEAELRAKSKDYAPKSSITGTIVGDMRAYIRWALDDVSQNEWELGRYRGELKKEELAPGKRRSDYGWVYDTLRVLPTERVSLCFGEAGLRFLRACEATLKNRKRRQKEMLRKITAGEVQPTSRATNNKKNRREYLPKPSVPPLELAKFIDDYSSIINEA
jgi:hypothetical protein